jgi:hypothetical protein
LVRASVIWAAAMKAVYLWPRSVNGTSRRSGLGILVVTANGYFGIASKGSSVRDSLVFWVYHGASNSSWISSGIDPHARAGRFSSLHIREFVERQEQLRELLGKTAGDLDPVVLDRLAEFGTLSLLFIDGRALCSGLGKLLFQELGDLFDHGGPANRAGQFDAAVEIVG